MSASTSAKRSKIAGDVHGDREREPVREVIPFESHELKLRDGTQTKPFLGFTIDKAHILATA
jgi:hypothetical protein